MKRLTVLIGALILAAIPATPGASVTDATIDLRIAAFNVRGGYDGNWDERLPGVVATMIESQAKIFILNEAHEEAGEHTEILAELKRQSGYTGWVLHSGDGGNHFITDGGLFRKVAKNIVGLPYGANTYVELNLWHRSKGVRFWVWDTHLDAIRSGQTTEEAQAIRRAQVKAFSDEVDRLTRSVGGGDINEWSDENVRTTLLTLGHYDVRTRTTDVTNGDWDSHELHYGPNQMRGRWIDALFAGSRVTVRRAGLVDSGDSSDHNLIWTDVSITGPVTSY